MPEPIITIPWQDDGYMEMLDWSKVKVNGELATDLLAQRDALRAELQTWQEGCACTDKSKADVLALRARVVELEETLAIEREDRSLILFAERDNLRYHLQTLLHAYRTGNSISTIREAEMRKAANLPN